MTDTPSGGGAQARDFDRTRVGGGIDGQFRRDDLRFAMGADGIAGVQAPQGDPPIAPPLTPDTLVCIADTSKFVFRDEWGEVLLEFEESEVHRAPNGRWFVTEIEIARKANAVGLARHWCSELNVPWFDDAQMFERFYEDRPGLQRIEIEPIRPACKRMARHMTDLEGASHVVSVERLCTAMRDEQGALYSLRDTQMFACELREPRDPRTEARLEKFDDGKIRLGLLRVEEEGFVLDEDLDRHLGESNELDRTGIFR